MTDVAAVMTSGWCWECCLYVQVVWLTCDVVRTLYWTRPTECLTWDLNRRYMPCCMHTRVTMYLVHICLLGLRHTSTNFAILWQKYYQESKESKGFLQPHLTNASTVLRQTRKLHFHSNSEPFYKRSPNNTKTRFVNCLAWKWIGPIL